ncbi:MAG TPA: pyridoxal-phosphate dependent enzyme [Ktedonobacteraceae bacterium]|nr:pyridoxal-phosphate dependent enzyme [Ktedonobacteraceae bacterium]
MIDLRGVVDLTPGELNGLVHQIGNTPIQPIYLVLKGVARKVHLKLEGANPTGSMKDRTGFGLVQDLEGRGLLHKGSTIIESTSGNLGVALALLCKAKEYGFVAVVDPKTTAENIAKMQTLGARIDMVHQPDKTGGYLLSRLAHVQELCRLSSAYTWTDQYSNPANPRIHYAHTGPEIYRQMRGKVDAIFVPVSTGGTLAGIGRFFRQVSPSTRIIGVDAQGSVVFGTPPAPRKLTGIGSSRPSSFISNDLYDMHMLVGDEEAFAFCRALYSSTDIKVGGSSGAVLAACARYLLSHPYAAHVVCVCADNGENYVSSIFNDVWVQQQGLDLSRDRLGAVQDIVQERKPYHAGTSSYR